MDITQFYQTFFEEADELLAEMERCLLGLDLQAPDSEQLNAIFRAAHSIKGGAATFGFAALTDTTHLFENLLDRARHGQLQLSPATMDAFLNTKDELQLQLGAYRSGSEPDAARVADICAVLQRLALESQGAGAGAGAGAPRPAGADANAGQGAHSAPGASPGLAGAQPWGAAAPAPEAGSAAPGQGAALKLHFVRVGEADRRLLADELAQLGQLQGLTEGLDTLTVWLNTSCSPDELLAVCGFVVDEAQITVSAASASSAAAAAPAEAAMPDSALAGSTDGRSPHEGTAPEAAEPQGHGLGVPGPGEDAAGGQAAGAVQSAACGTGHAGAAPAHPAGTTAPEAASGPLNAAAPAAAQPGSGREAPQAAPRAASGAGPAGRPPGGAPAGGAAPAVAKESSIRVDVGKVDQIINLVGELVITQAMLAQTASTLDPVLHQRLLSGLGHLERNARDLQESVMSIRMMPMDYVFSRFPRLIRDLSAKLGKQVALETEGSETELDKGLIERIIDPLTHLVRNSLDHGIETPERRRAAGKDPMGRLVLSAQHQGGSIVIEVRDDGGGLSRERILAKARERGMAVADSMPDEDVWLLIFAAGFSTAETVTDVSGRGVGMDVVRRNIQEMGGQVQIRSQPGRGTVIRIVLPLTLAILNGMAVRVGTEVYILPLSDVIESLQPKAQDVHRVADGQPLLHVRGEYLSLVSLAHKFGVSGAGEQPTDGIAVIVQAEGEHFALLVDELLGQHQVVVKNLETNYRRVAGISAATILGDGNVALIVDVAACGGKR